MKAQAENYVQNILKPFLEKCLLSGMEINAAPNDPVALELKYLSLLDGTTSSYIQERVLLEFGGRNVVTPLAYQPVIPYLNAYTTNLVFPSPTVQTLSPERTFWEKATLIHAELGRKNYLDMLHRKVRHWYDLYQIIQSRYGQRAIENTQLLRDVVTHKKVFFQATYAKYDDCLNKRFRLIPDKIQIDALKKDFEQMKQSGMFFQKPISFEVMLEELKLLQDKLNT